MTDPLTLVTHLEARVRPLEVALAEAWWDAYTTTSPEADSRRKRLEVERRALLGDAAAFAEVTGALSSLLTGADPYVRRQLELLRNAMLPHQVASELREWIVELETDVESTFNAFRGELADRPVDDDEIVRILRTSDDVAERRAAWEASKQVGAVVAARVRELARLRNVAARALGFRDHFALALTTGELHETRLFATLREVDAVTEAPFTAWKAALDGERAGRFACAPDALRPWHYDDPFFQDPPARGTVELDPLLADADLTALTLRTYDGLGLDVRAVLEHSDLVPRPGKSQHAFCIDVDREGDVRVLSNNTPGERWAETMLHEFGHAVYDRNIDGSLPWLLRQPAHALTTEGVAMLFGRLSRDPEWLVRVAHRAPGEVERLVPHLAATRRAALLVFARWVLVMTSFERGFYADPDADHDARWWDLVERFQLLRRPDGRQAPDWAAKIHVAAAPVYYQNYLYGELVASQLQDALAAHAGGIVDRPDAGRFLVARVFRPGSTQRWDNLVADMTGEDLSASHLARQLSA